MKIKKENNMVIQRWQTVYLLMAAILMIIFSFVPYAVIHSDSIYQLSEIGCKSAIGDVEFPACCFWGVFAVGGVLVPILSLITIFLYKNLKLQMKMCVINLCLTVAVVAALVVLAFLFSAQLECKTLEFKVSLLMPIASVILYILAYSGIKKDKKRIGDSYRIR